MKEIVFDIETTSLFKRDGKTKENDVKVLMCTFGIVYEGNIKYKTLFAQNYDDIPNFLQRVSDKFSELKPMKLITFNGTKFDIPVLRRNFVDYNINGTPLLNIKHVDVYQEMIIPNFYFGTAYKSKSLKTLSEQWLGYKYTMDGKDFYKLYDEWVETEDNTIIEKLIEYNRVDVENTYKIYNRLYNFTPVYWRAGKLI